MKKHFIACTILSFLILNVRADDDNPPLGIGLVTGSVIDAVSNEPLPYVNIVVRNSSDSILTAAGVNAAELLNNVQPSFSNRSRHHP